MARAMWKAALELGSHKLPVKLYAAIEDRGVHFRLLHRADGTPVRQRMVDPRSGEEIAAEQVQRGVEVEPGVFVVLRPDELEAAQPRAGRALEVLRFVPRAAIDLAWYERPYYLGPDGSADDYAALVAALRESERVGIARWTLRGRRYAGALEARGPHLVLVTLRGPRDVVSADELGSPAGPAIRDAERRLAEQLIQALDAPFDPDELHDTYGERVRALIEAKQHGRTLRIDEPQPPRVRGDLAAALRRSLKAAKESRSAA